MKGRRLARRAALQALYELDMTRHSVDEVLAARTENLCAMAATGFAQSLAERAALEHLWRCSAQGHGQAPNGQELAQQFGIPAERTRTLVEFAQRVEQQIRYLRAIVLGVQAHRAALDEVIARIAPEWPVAQMAPIDRNVLRIALWELAGGKVPQRVAINEAIELARAFSGEGARRMVNGALGAYVSGSDRLRLDEPVGSCQAEEV